MATTTRKPVPVQVDNKGRVVLPASFRKALRLTKPEDSIFVLWQHAEREYAEGRAVSLEEFAAREGIDLNAPENA